MAGRTECFEMDGALVRGNPDMSPESREALREVLAAARAAYAATPRCLCSHTAERHAAGPCDVRSCGCRTYRPTAGS